MEAKSIRETLAVSHLFSELSDAQMERVRRHSHYTDMLEGESLFFQGDNANNFYLTWMKGMTSSFLPQAAA